MRRWRFCALGSTLEVSSVLPQLDERLDALLRGYEIASSSDRASPRYSLCEADEHVLLLRDEKVLYRSEGADDLLDFFQIDLYRRIVAQAHERWLLHAAALSKNGQALVLAGPSNAGKSTLCRALMETGWDYLSEEIASLTNEDVDALRRPLHLEHPSQLANLSGFSPPVRMREEPQSWIASPPKRPNGAARRAMRVLAIIRIQYRPDEPTQLAPLAPSTALEQLWDCRMNTGLDVARLASKIVANTPCYRLDSQDVPSALAALISSGLA